MEVIQIFFRVKTFILFPLIVVFVFFALNLALVPVVRASGPVFSIDFDDQFLYAGTDDGIDIYSKEEWKKQKSYLKGVSIRMIKISEEGIFILTRDGKVQLLDNDGELQTIFDPEEIKISILTPEINAPHSIEVDENYIYLGTLFGQVKIYNKESLSFLNKIDIDSQETVVKLRRYGDYLYIGKALGEIIVWDLVNGQVLKRFNPVEFEGDKEKGLWKLFIDEAMIYSAHTDGIVRIWDKTTGELVKKIDAYGSDVMALTVDEQYIYTGGSVADRNIKIWTKEGELKKEIRHHLSSVLDLAVDGDKLYSASADESIAVWNVDDFSLAQTVGEQIEAIKEPGLANRIKTTLRKSLKNEAAALAIVVGILLSLSIFFEFWQHLKGPGRQKKKAAIFEFIRSYTKPGDLLLIVLLGTSIIVIIGLANPTLVFPMYTSGVTPSQYFEVFVKTGAFKIVWFVLPPIFTYWAVSRIKVSSRNAFLLVILSLLVSILAYLYLSMFA